jgi:hypothetical protein
MNGMNSYFRGGKCGILLLFVLNDINARRSWVFDWIDSVAGGMHCTRRYNANIAALLSFSCSFEIQAETSSPFAGQLSMLSSLVVLILKNNTNTSSSSVLRLRWYLVLIQLVSQSDETQKEFISTE